MDQKKVSHVICPYCCHKFEPNEADFRLAVPVGRERTTKKTKKIQNSSFGKELDDKLYNYHMDILKSSDEEAMKNSMKYLSVSLSQTSEVSYVETDLLKYGFVPRITYTAPDGLKYTAEKRLCPNCHNELPSGYGLRETILISIIGDARAGKSIYLTMLINELENNMDFVSKLNFIGDKSAKESIFNSYQKPLLTEHKLVNSTKRKKVPPFSYNYWYQYKGEDGLIMENTIDIIFYDIAGEDLHDDLDIRQNGFNIKDSSGLIFLLDPTNFKKMEELFMLKDRRLIDSIPADNSIKNIFSAMFNYFLGLDNGKSQIPLALAVSKADLFNFVDMDFFSSRPKSRILNYLEGEVHKDCLKMGSLRGLNQEVRELLAYLNEEPILNNAQGCFKNINCFAISSLGKKPIIEQVTDPETNEVIERGYVDGDLEPFRVKEPFYWILLKNNLIYRFEEGVYYKNNEIVTLVKDSYFERVKRLFAKLLKK